MRSKIRSKYVFIVLATVAAIIVACGKSGQSASTSTAAANAKVIEGYWMHYESYDTDEKKVSGSPPVLDKFFDGKMSTCNEGWEEIGTYAYEGNVIKVRSRRRELSVARVDNEKLFLRLGVSEGNYREYRLKRLSKEDAEAICSRRSKK